MKISEAEAILRDATHEDDGTYTLLRLGRDPGAEAVRGLLSAIQLIDQRYSDEDTIPHQVAFSCGMILRFDSECLQNLKATGAAPELFDAVADLSQAAFNALAGCVADQWRV